MSSIILRGGHPLYGNIEVSGSKNAALPILFATVITEGISCIRALPDIGDVRVALKILEGFGARIERSGSEVKIDTEHINYRRPSLCNVSAIRASTYLIGSCVSRFGECDLLPFGGCNFSDRPIDMHLYAARRLGGKVLKNKIYATRLLGSKILFDKPSVGATVNAILLASRAEGLTEIYGGAKEPHVDALIEFLVSAGACIRREDGVLKIEGRRLHGGDITVVGDMIEAGTYLALGVATGGCVSVLGCPEEHISSTLSALSDIGADICRCDKKISARRGRILKSASITALPYPGFPTDLQPVFSALFATLSGGFVTDTVWRSRFGYLKNLGELGVRYEIKENTARIYPSEIKAGRTVSPDLRGGMACVLAALSAEGESVIESADTVLRGYESLDKKLSSLGAEIVIE